MELLDLRLQLRQTLPRRFYQQEPLLCRLDLALPAINGSDGASKNVHARSEPGIYDGASNAKRFPSVGARHEDHEFVGQEEPPGSLLFLAVVISNCLPLAQHATIRREPWSILVSFGCKRTFRPRPKS
jgi:hypothetical protein